VICITNKCGQRSENCPTPSKCMGGGNYYAALHAENNFQHIHAPAPVATVKPYAIEYCGDEPMSDCAKAIVIVFALACLACVLAAAIYH
jgi:hypothetical protein